jgi:hypothetical protein
MSETSPNEPAVPTDSEADEKAAKPASPDRRWVKLGVGAAIGSAAIAAALLYANRPSKNDRS